MYVDLSVTKNAAQCAKVVFCIFMYPMCLWTQEGGIIDTKARGQGWIYSQWTV
jgi:hypothetical protein